MERVPKEGGFIIASNHIGRLDAPLVYYLLGRRDIVLMVAEKYARVPGLRWFANRLDAIWVDRFNADLSALRASINVLKKGAILVLAPEGTRSKTGSLNEAKPGTSFLAIKANVPILPVALLGTWDVEVVSRLKRLKRLDIEVRVGEPFRLPPLQRQNREEAMQAYTDEIMLRIAALLPPELRGVYTDHPRLPKVLKGEEDSQPALA
jgi:1-acyl-sn-glycerol-3-phosphate acyltransferase